MWFLGARPTSGGALSSIAEVRLAREWRPVVTARRGRMGAPQNGAQTGASLEHDASVGHQQAAGEGSEAEFWPGLSA